MLFVSYKKIRLCDFAETESRTNSIDRIVCRTSIAFQSTLFGCIEKTLCFSNLIEHLIEFCSILPYFLSLIIYCVGTSAEYSRIFMQFDFLCVRLLYSFCFTAFIEQYFDSVAPFPRVLSSSWKYGTRERDTEREVPEREQFLYFFIIVQFFNHSRDHII